MNKIRTIAYGITLSSLVIGGFSQQDQQKTIAASTEKGILTLVINGEDFVRQGFVSKDGWEINFDHVYVNIDDAIAYSTKSAFEPQKGDSKESIEYQNRVDFDLLQNPADLAAGEVDAEPIVVAETSVTTDFYNALAWKLSTADDTSPMAGNTIMLIGKAVKDEATIDFNLGFNQPTEYICGEFVGESRQGIVTAQTPGTVEATLHFDHIFGDADVPQEEALNQDALGFQPLANLANNGIIKLEPPELSNQLSSSDYQQLTDAISGLGHVGEGHCVVNATLP